ncbi:MAG: nucleotide-binding protein [Protaetiibacter sp.]
MVKFTELQFDLQKKLNVSARTVNRRIKEREDATLQSREVAALMVAVDAGLSVKKYATSVELAELRQAQQISGQATPAPAARAAAPSAAPRQRGRQTSAPRAARPKRGREVMVVHGRDEKAKDAMFAFLKALDLKPLEWTTGIKETGSANPTVQQIVNALFSKASAVVVLLTPDDEARLRAPFHEANDPPHEVNLTPQARPNVLFEAGMAISSHPDRTVMVQIGYVRPFTDIGGSFITHMTNHISKRKELATKLSAACAVDMDGEGWRTAAEGGDFEYGKEEKDG